jgi:hypothetical protein
MNRKTPGSSHRSATSGLACGASVRRQVKRGEHETRKLALFGSMRSEVQIPLDNKIAVNELIYHDPTAWGNCDSVP